MKEFLTRFKEKLWTFDHKFGVSIIPHAYRLGVIYIIGDAIIRFSGVLVPSYQLGRNGDFHLEFLALIILVFCLSFVFAVIKFVIWRAICEFAELFWKKRMLEAAE